MAGIINLAGETIDIESVSYLAEWIFSKRLTIGGVAMVPSAMNHTIGSYSLCTKNYLVTWLYLMRGWGIPIDLWFIDSSCVNRYKMFDAYYYAVCGSV